MNTAFLYQALISFMALLITDICWAVYVRKVGDKHPLQSAMWAVFLFLSGAVAVIGYTTNPWLLIPAGAGAFAGTWLGVWFGNRKKAPVISPAMVTWANQKMADRRRDAYADLKAGLSKEAISLPLDESLRADLTAYGSGRTAFFPGPALMAAIQDSNEQLRRTHGKSTQSR